MYIVGRTHGEGILKGGDGVGGTGVLYSKGGQPREGNPGEGGIPVEGEPGRR
jgi:hypothetical protein